MRGLRAIGAIFAAPPRLDAEQTATLNLLAPRMLQMNSAALGNQIEQGLMTKRSELSKLHYAVMLSERMTNDECLMTKE